MLVWLQSMYCTKGTYTLTYVLVVSAEISLPDSPTKGTKWGLRIRGGTDQRPDETLSQRNVCSRSEHYSDEALCPSPLALPLFIRCRQDEPKAGPLPDEIDPAGNTAGQHLIVRYSKSVLYMGIQQTGLNQILSPGSACNYNAYIW